MNCSSTATRLTCANLNCTNKFLNIFFNNCHETFTQNPTNHLTNTKLGEVQEICPKEQDDMLDRLQDLKSGFILFLDF